jgi:anti-anti-sigma regulatory factor
MAGLVIEPRDQIEGLFKLHPFHGRIVIDLSDGTYVDSAGLGALVRLKMSAIKGRRRQREPRANDTA